MKISYICKFCGKQLLRPCALGIHERTCKNNTERKPLENHVCNFNKKTIDNSDKWICYICDKHFRVRRELFDHLKTHTDNEKTTICKFCGKSFLKTKIGGHTTFCELNPNSNLTKQKCFENNKMRGTHHSEEEKNNLSEKRKEFLKENPDKVPYLLNHYSKGDSYPEKYFKEVLDNEKIEYKQNYYQIGYFLDFAWPEKKTLFRD